MIIYDFTSRLPGPLATSLLQDKGFQVIKIENKNRPDPFSIDRKSIFYYWYKKINQKKIIRKVDFENLESCKDLHKKITSSKKSCLLIPNSRLFTEQILQLNLLQKKKKVFSIVPSHKSQIKLHDTDFLFLQGYFELQKKIKSPSLPTLPYGGLTFAQHIALTISTQLLLDSKTNGHFPISLKEDLSKEFFSKIIPTNTKVKEMQMDQAGDLLCYHMYKINKHTYLSLTALEKKTFLNICTKLKLESKYTVNQYSRDKNLIKSLEQRLKKISVKEFIKIAKSTQGLNILEA